MVTLVLQIWFFSVLSVKFSIWIKLVQWSNLKRLPNIVNRNICIIHQHPLEFISCHFGPQTIDFITLHPLCLDGLILLLSAKLSLFSSNSIRKYNFNQVIGEEVLKWCGDYIIIIKIEIVCHIIKCFHSIDLHKFCFV